MGQHFNPWGDPIGFSCKPVRSGLYGYRCLSVSPSLCPSVDSITHDSINPEPPNFADIQFGQKYVLSSKMGEIG